MNSDSLNGLAKDGSLCGAICHGDADADHCSHDFVERPGKLGMIISMVRGNVYKKVHACYMLAHLPSHQASCLSQRSASPCSIASRMRELGDSAFE